MSYRAALQAAGGGASADDGVDSYADRLTGEAQRRERSAAEGGKEDGSSGASLQDVSFQDLIQQMMGGDGPAVKFEVVMGDGSEVDTGGGGGLGGLIESLRLQMEGGEDDDDDDDDDDDEVTDDIL